MKRKREKWVLKELDMMEERICKRSEKLWRFGVCKGRAFPGLMQAFV